MQSHSLSLSLVEPSHLRHGLSLPSATGMNRGFLVLHSRETAADSVGTLPNVEEGESTVSDAVQAFIADLLEFGGMAVIA